MGNHNDGKEIEAYKEAVWSFLVEHSKVLKSGKMVIVFHTDGRQNFENRVLSRWKYNYHREDWEKKDKERQKIREDWATKKLEKKQKYIQEKKDRIEAKEKIKKALKDLERKRNRKWYWPWKINS